ncbi:hypothetical protein NDU88_001771 [Pleurodeles waltl]|uniref:Uncharacterized protein n=1 Tax=Pleurodeles waltl TaxID=8319 RepID=A0AAV7LYK9_PLEWA|nr:hypothetical protein NDU88_001771 [Pleurodeles waltl]
MFWTWLSTSETTLQGVQWVAGARLSVAEAAVVHSVPAQISALQKCSGAFLKRALRAPSYLCGSLLLGSGFNCCAPRFALKSNTRKYARRSSRREVVL